MLCEHGNVAPCVECAVEPLKAENEVLREGMRKVNATAERHEREMYLAKDEAEALRARVAELEDLAAEAALLFEDIQQGEYIVDSFTAQPYNAVQINMSSKPWLLRKQAEAVEQAAKRCIPKGLSLSSILDYAQRLRQQADEAERAGGEK